MEISSINSRSTYITMQVFSGDYTTHNMPHIEHALQELLPSIFLCTCYNDGNIPFREEATKTELGHLYEHILLEVMAIMERTKGGYDKVFRGVTSWDWYKEEPGTFHIRLNVGVSSSLMLLQAMEHAAEIFDKVIYS